MEAIRRAKEEEEAQKERERTERIEAKKQAREARRPRKPSRTRRGRPVRGSQALSQKEISRRKLLRHAKETPSDMAMCMWK